MAKLPYSTRVAIADHGETAAVAALVAAFYAMGLAFALSHCDASTGVTFYSVAAVACFGSLIVSLVIGTRHAAAMVRTIKRGRV